MRSAEAEALPKEIADEERLARYVFSPSMVDEYGVSRQAFQLDNLERGPEKYVSVERASYREPKSENYKYNPRKKNDSLVGYAELSAGAVRTLRVKDVWAEVKAHGNKSNPYHAGIHYHNYDGQIAGECEDGAFIIFITRLSKIAHFHEF